MNADLDTFLPEPLKHNVAVSAWSVLLGVNSLTASAIKYQLSLKSTKQKSAIECRDFRPFHTNVMDLVGGATLHPPLVSAPGS